MGYRKFQRVCEAETARSSGAGALALATVAVLAGERRRLAGFTLHLDVAPICADNLLITLDAAAGAEYDTNLLNHNLAGVTDLVWFSDGDVLLGEGDRVVVAYANPDGRTYGAQATLEVV